MQISFFLFFGYNLNDTQDGPRYWRNGIYICVPLENDKTTQPAFNVRPSSPAKNASKIADNGQILIK